MAKRTAHTKRTAPRLRTPVLTLDDVDDRVESTEQEILGALEAPEDGVTYQIRVFQLTHKPNGNPEEAYLFDIAANELADIWARLRDTPGLGTGSYRVRVRRNEPGSSVQIGQMTRAVKSLMPTQAPLPATAPASDALMQRLDRLERLLDKPAAPALDLVQAFQVFATMQANLIAQHPPATAAAVNPMEIFQSGVEFARELGAPGEKGIGDIVTSLAPVLEKFITQAMPGNAGGGAPAAAALPAPGAPAGPRLPIEQQYLLELINQLGDMAKKNIDPAQAADWVFDNAPLAMIRQIASDPAMLDQLASMVPVVAQYRGFFSALRGELQKGMMPDDLDDAAAGAPGEPAGQSNGSDARNPQVDAPANP